jgi:hypothetical protein
MIDHTLLVHILVFEHSGLQPITAYFLPAQYLLEISIVRMGIRGIALITTQAMIVFFDQPPQSELIQQSGGDCGLARGGKATHYEQGHR